MATARTISIAMTVLGLALAIGGPIFELGPLVTISGMLLFVAGIVKIGMVLIWGSLFTRPIESSRDPSSANPETEVIRHD